MGRFVASVTIAVALFAPAAPAFAQRDAAKATIERAQQGDAAAQFRLGEMYDLGQGVRQDYAEAVRWYRRAAEQGNARAQFSLAEMIKNGDGVAKSLPEAAKWYRRAAEQGNRDAQLLLGVLYEGGEGVPQDVNEAARWYRRSAEQGDARAQLLLGVLFQLGNGVPRSYPAAWALYTLSANAEARGNPAPGHRAQLARAMSADETELAKTLAAEMARPGNFGAALDNFLAVTTQTRTPAR